MSPLQFSGKAETLDMLRGQLRFARLLPQLHFCLKEWRDAGGRWERLGLHADWLSQSLMVRSSAKIEDQYPYSMAGRYLSVANVKGKAAIQKAIESVIESFEGYDAGHQVLIQPMVTNIRVNGVAFSYEPGQPGPYYVINFDEDSQSGHQVTRGLSNHLKLIYIARSASPALFGWKRQLFSLLKELECLFGNDAIDVEFVVTTDNELILLQVRPLAIKTAKLLSEDRQNTILETLKKRFRLACQNDETCLGKSNIWGVMPDWNPAEIIGLRPKPLTYSLYRHLVTDEVWARQRHEYGYRNVCGVPLMLNLCGIPYVDVRASFNSFIPNQLPRELATRLVDFYLYRLNQHPEWHDKVEFNIVLASDHFDLREELNVLLRHGFSRHDCSLIEDALRELTRKTIDGENGLWLGECQKVQQLPRLHGQTMDSALDDRLKLKRLLELCREFGTGPFAGLARTAFVAMKFLHSLVTTGVITKAEQAHFMQSVSTLNGGLLTSEPSLSRKQFFKRYGHLRAGMYDLLSPRYDEMPSEYFSWNPNAKIKKPSAFVLNKKQAARLDRLLVQHGYSYTANNFMEFIRLAIERRENAKFIFSRTLSEILLSCQKLGEKYQLENQQLVYLEIDQVLQLANKEEALRLVEKAEERFKETRSLILPSLISREEDIDCFQLQVQQPNFITLKRVTARVVHLTSNPVTLSADLEGAIVVLTNADPGFDWLFLHNIAGLVTLYGGCNSHMAIRAAELGLPAVIGAGEVLFRQCANAKLLSLDCEQQTVCRLK